MTIEVNKTYTRLPNTSRKPYQILNMKTLESIDPGDITKDQLLAECCHCHVDYVKPDGVWCPCCGYAVVYRRGFPKRLVGNKWIIG